MDNPSFANDKSRTPPPTYTQTAPITISNFDKPPDKKYTRTIVPTGLEEDPRFQNLANLDEKVKASKKYAGNRIHTTKYTILSFIPKNLFEQFHRLANVYFVIVAFLNFIPSVEAVEPMLSIIPVIVILSVTAIKDIIEDYRRYRNDKDLNNSQAFRYQRSKDHHCNKPGDGQFTACRWKDLRPGDIIFLALNHTIPADCVLLGSSDKKGICYIETSNIDGETNLKERRVVRDVCQSEGEVIKNAGKSFNYFMTIDRPKATIDQFQGVLHQIHQDFPLPDGDSQAITKENFLLRGCKIRNTDYVHAIVVYAGHETKAMLNNTGPRMKRSKLEQRMNKDILYCFGLLLFFCGFAAIANNVFNAYVLNTNPGVLVYYPPTNLDLSIPPTSSTYSSWESGFTNFFRMIVLLQILIPISLYVSLEIVKTIQILFITWDDKMHDRKTNKRIQCRAMNISEDLGQIEYVFSDKTGTLTENEMIFQKCSISGIDYSGSKSDRNPREEKIRTYRRSNSRSFSGLRKNHRKAISNASRRSLGESLGQNVLQQLEDYDNSENRGDWRPPPETIPIGIDDMLVKRVTQIKKDQIESNLHKVDINNQELRVLEFFTCLSICNTVVMTECEREKIQEKAKQKRLSVTSLEKKKKKGFKNNLVIKSLTKLPTIYKPKVDGLKVADGTELANLETMNKVMKDTTDSSSEVSHYEDENVEKLTIKEIMKDLDPETPFQYESESPDEVALVEAAQAYNFHLLQRSPQQICFAVPGYEYPWEFPILHIFPFNSDRKRMSIVVRHPVSQEIILYCKGADGIIMDMLETRKNCIEDPEKTQRLINLTQDTLNRYAEKGLRTLCIARKILTVDEYGEWLKKDMKPAEVLLEGRDEAMAAAFTKLETGLELIGATGI